MVNRRINSRCKLGILKIKEYSQDGFKIKAVNSKEKNYTKNKVIDRINREKKEISKQEKEIRTLKEEQEKVEKYLERLKEEVEKIKFMPTIEVPEEALGYWDASLNKDNSVMAWYIDSDSNNLYELYIGGYGKVYAPANSDYLFRSFNKLTDIDFANVFDTSKTITMLSLFNRCNTLVNLNVENFITTNVTNMNYMFYNCSGLINLDLSSFNTEKVTNMGGMFSGCVALTTLNVSNFDTSKVTTMYYMFASCSSLISLDVSNFNTSNVTTMSGMFYNCSSLQSLSLSSWITKNVINMGNMFNGCLSLISLDLRDFDFSNVTNFAGIFVSASKLKELNLSNVTSVKYSNSNFQSILMLVPSSSTIYVKDSDCITKGQSINSNVNYVVYEESI